MRRLAERLGIRASSLYKHLPNKRALETALVAVGFEDWLKAFETAADSADSLPALVRAYRTYALEHPALYRLMTERPLDRAGLPAELEDRTAGPIRRRRGWGRRSRPRDVGVRPWDDDPRAERALPGGGRPRRRLGTRGRGARSLSSPRRCLATTSTRCTGSTSSTAPTARCWRTSRCRSCPGAKIGVLGPNGAGKSTLLRIMAGQGGAVVRRRRARARARRSGLLEQEPELDPAKDVRGNVEDGVRELRDLLDRFNEISAAFAEPDADFDALLAEQAKVQDADRPRATPGSSTTQLDHAMDALRLPDGDRDVDDALRRRAPPRRALPAAPLRRPTCCCSTSRRTTSTPSRSPGSSASSPTTRARSSPSRTTATSSTTSPAGSSSSTAAAASRSRATTRRGSSRSRSGSRIEEKTESARRRTLARELEWVRAEPARAAREVEGAPRRVREAARRGAERQARHASRSTSRRARASATS